MSVLTSFGHLRLSDRRPAVARSAQRPHRDPGEFYARRIRRLFRRTWHLLTASTAATLLVLAPDEWGEVFSAMGAVLLCVVNLWFTGRATDYFADHGAASPFLHLWSLAVEEQFYLVWPWLVVLCL